MNQPAKHPASDSAELDAYERSIAWATERHYQCEGWSEAEKEALRRRIKQALASCPTRTGADEGSRDIPKGPNGPKR